MILPVPTVPEMAAENASNCETEFLSLPFLPFFISFTAGTMVLLIDSPNLRTCNTFVLTVSKMPVPKIIMIIGKPHTTPFTQSFTLVTASINESHIIFSPLFKNKKRAEPEKAQPRISAAFTAQYL